MISYELSRIYKLLNTLNHLADRKSLKKMEQIKLKDEVQALKKLSEQYEQQLKLIGFELTDLPDDVAAMLDDTAKLQHATNLHDIHFNYLREFYFINKKERIENDAIIGKQQAELRKLDQELAENERELSALDKFINSAQKRLVSDAQLQRMQLGFEAKMQGLLERQEALRLPDDFNIDELIKKIDILQHHSEAKEK